MYIIIDTSSIYGDLRLTGAKIRTLCETAKITAETVCFPQVVIDEAKNNYYENLISLKSKIDKNLSDIKRLTGKTQTTSLNKKSFDDEITNFNKNFDDQLVRLGIKIIPYPQTTHKIIVRKAVKKKKPFIESGKGYRDALIWENVKELLKPSEKLIEDPQGVLITSNHHDFCENDYQLHTDLKEELTLLGVPENSVEIISDFEKFISKYCEFRLKILDEIKHDLQEGKHKKRNIRNKVEKLVFSYLDNRAFATEDLGFPQEFESPSVDVIHEDYEFHIDEVRQLSDEEIIINGTVKVTCTFDVFIFKGDYYAMGEDETPEVWDYDWNDHYVAASKEKTIRLNVFLTVDNTFDNIISNEIEIAEDEIP